jgi:hypothetical protein
VLLEEVGQYIVNQGLVPSGWVLMKGSSEDLPDKMIVVREYGGGAPSFVHSIPGIAIENPRIQVECRSKSYMLSRSTAEAIYRKLATVSQQTLSGCRYLRITPLQSPFLMGRDANNRERIVFNATVMKEVSSS